MLMLSFNLIHCGDSSLVHFCSIHHLFEYCSKASWVGCCHRLSLRCHYICQGWQCHYMLCWRYTLTLHLECLWTHGTVCDFSWSMLLLIGFFDRALGCNFALAGSLTSWDNLFLWWGKTDSPSIALHIPPLTCLLLLLGPANLSPLHIFTRFWYMVPTGELYLYTTNKTALLLPCSIYIQH